MPVKKKKKISKPVSKKKKSVKKIKKPRAKKKSALAYPDSLPELVEKIPEDKYTEALLQQEQLRQERPVINEPLVPAKEPVKKVYSKVHLWALVLISFVVIFAIWLLTWQFDMNIYSNQGQTVSQLGSEFVNNFSDLQKTIDTLGDNVATLENMSNQNGNANVNAVINNPNNLSNEEIDKIEDELFPKLK